MTRPNDQEAAETIRNNLFASLNLLEALRQIAAPVRLLAVASGRL